MTLLGTIGGFLGKVPAAIGFIVQLGKQIAPFIRAAREVSPDVEAIVVKIEEKVEAGGAEADDFLDRNVETVRDLHGFFTELESVGRDGQSVTGFALQASQEDSPDTLTPAEIEELIGRIGVLKDSLQDLGTNSGLEEKLAALE